VAHIVAVGILRAPKDAVVGRVDELHEERRRVEVDTRQELLPRHRPQNGLVRLELLALAAADARLCAAPLEEHEVEGAQRAVSFLLL